MRYGYARVSSKGQNIAGQIAQLQKAGCDKIVRDDGISGSTISKRPALVALCKKMKTGDQLVICSLDRLARSLRDLIRLVDEFEGCGVQLRSLKEDLNTGTPGGRLIFHIFGALAEFERALIAERTQAGRRREGAKKPGPKPKMNRTKLKVALELIELGKQTREEIATSLEVDRATLYRALRNIQTVPRR